ncbi:hypothetical protein [Actinophytocola sp.]|uniref:hypothetical protein n=1 Tax=Actinophytocola sp. TaxID=1872138 RepID=UPI002D800292|nr:hypothetical protein [Actinophytocola sp.]HET9138697.1 hypothetical protein [Actinophytocola sp.]
MARHVYTEEGLQRLDRENPRVQRLDVNPDDSVGARPVHDVAGTGMDGFEVDLAELLRTEHDLAGLHDTLVGFMNDATALAGPLKDGSSPVAKHMQRAFFERADLDGGLQQALREYMRELLAIREALLATVRSYQSLDAGVVDRINRQMTELDGEA